MGVRPSSSQRALGSAPCSTSALANSISFSYNKQSNKQTQNYKKREGNKTIDFHRTVHNHRKPPEQFRKANLWFHAHSVLSKKLNKTKEGKYCIYYKQLT
jgi:hypothetical protein